MADYLPHREAELVIWSNNFAAVLTDEPEPYGVTVEQAAAFAAKQTAFAAAYQYANDGQTRSPANIQTKDLTKEAMVAEARALARIIQATPGMDNAKRARLGISLRDDEPTPVPVPSESPVIDLVSVNGWTVEIRLHNGDATRRAKPEGVQGAYVFTYVGDVAPTNVNAWKFEGSTSRTHSKVVFPGELAPGTRVWITAAWANPKLQTGPAATPRSTQINFGGMSGNASQAA